MNRAKIAISMLALLLPLAAFAHGGGPHVMGTVKSLDDKSITVTTKTGEDTTFALDEKTRFEKSGAQAAAKDLAVGERVVVHSRKEGDGLAAVMVKFGAPQHKPKHDHSHGQGSHDKGAHDEK